MSRQTLVRRLDALESRPGARVSAELVARLAADAGVTTEELLAEAEAIARQFAEAGLVTYDQQLAFIADEHGVTVDQVREDIAALGIPPWR